VGREITQPTTASPVDPTTTMPLHRIYHPNTLFTDPAEREALANAITIPYAGLPKFFVNVVFIPLEPSYLYTGGKPQTNWVRITVEHLAAQMAPEDMDKFHEFVTRYEAVLKPFIQDKGIEHELSFYSVPHEPWRMNGIRPPDLGTLAMKKWFAENKTSAYVEAEGRRPDGRVVTHGMIWRGEI